MPLFSKKRLVGKSEAADARIPAWVALLPAVLLLAGSLGREVWTPDEPREAALALAMSRSGQWVIPELAGRAFVEKPPLYYMVGACFIRGLGGQVGTTGALRIAGATWGLLCLGAVYLLAFRLLGRQRAMTVVCMFGVMPGFLQVSHWLIVDQALMFFVAAAIWLFAESYCAARAWALPAAAAATAGAFLVKGALGPVVIGLAWLGLIFPGPAGLSNDAPRPGPGKWIAAHVLAALVFCALVCAWLAPFYLQAGPELFHEWLWRNHAGRFLGQTPDLGHQNGPFYYLGALPLYVLPWLPAFIAGVICAVRACRGNGWKSARRRLPIIWGLGGLLLLSVSGTKREIYLAPLLPAFALFAEAGLQWAAGSSFRYWRRAWNALCAAGLLVLAAVVWVAPLRGDVMALLGFEAGLPLPACVCALGLGLGIFVVCSKQISAMARHVALIALFGITLFETAAAVCGRFKNYAPAFRGFLAALEKHPGLRIATWNLDETTRAGLYYFGNGAAWPALSGEDEIIAVLEGRHSCYNAVVSYRKIGKTRPVENLAPEHASTLALEVMGNDRELRLAAPPERKEH